MKNKKAWLRIMEAFIAVMLIMGVLLYLYTKNISNPSKSEDAYNFEKIILEEIAFNSDLRTAVLNGDTSRIEAFVAGKVSPGIDFRIRICGLDDICGLDVLESEVFASERIISSNLDNYSPKKVKIFIWERG